jgi:signal peptidase I
MQTDPKLRAEIVLAAVELMGRAGRRGTVVVQGESMRPTLHPGQLLAVEFSPGAAARGDLLVFRQGETLLVHRLVGPAPSVEGRPRLRTRGDGVLVFDPPVDPERIVARVVAFKDGERWRSTRRRAARVYAWCLAWHDLFWGAVGVVLRRLENRLKTSGIGLRLRPAARAVDRLLLRCVHCLLSGPMHAAVAKPDGA